MVASMVVTVEREHETTGQGHVCDLTAEVSEAVASTGLSSGLATVFVSGSTAAVTTAEFEPGVVEDLDSALGRVAPRDGIYRHHLRWGDDNGSAHVRAALLGPSLTVPVRHGRLLLGTWQQIVLVECDTRPRTRHYVVHVMGE
jgi:secondary thiamine-phosphate synthase enzyme